MFLPDLIQEKGRDKEKEKSHSFKNIEFDKNRNNSKPNNDVDDDDGDDHGDGQNQQYLTTRGEKNYSKNKQRSASPQENRGWGGGRWVGQKKEEEIAPYYVKRSHQIERIIQWKALYVIVFMCTRAPQCFAKAVCMKM